VKALQYRAIGRAPEVVNVPDPTVGPGEVLLRVTAAGACHSDAFIISRSAEQYVFGPLPLTLGHECAGVVAEVGVGVDQVAVGEAVLVYPPWGCGVCRNCARGKENYCLRPGGARPPGIAGPGAMAEYLLVDDQRHLVPRNSRPGGARGAHRRRANPRPRPQSLPTLSLAGRMAAIEAEVSIVGVGEAALPVRVGSPARRRRACSLLGFAGGAARGGRDGPPGTAAHRDGDSFPPGRAGRV
jgi:hypothetical protein